MRTACRCDPVSAEDLVATIRLRLALLPDIRPHRVEAARADLASGLPPATALAAAIIHGRDTAFLIDRDVPRDYAAADAVAAHDAA